MRLRRNPKLVANAFSYDSVLPALESAESYLEKLGLQPKDFDDESSQVPKDKRRLLGVGASARAYALPDGNVLKLTTDRDDAEAAELIRRFGQVPGLIHVYDVRRFATPIRAHQWQATVGEFDYDADLYAIVTERVLPVSGQYGTTLRDVYGAFYDASEHLGHTKSLKQIIREHYLDAKAGALLSDLIDGWEWLRDHGYDVQDIHVGNIGEAKDGRIVLFDFGAESYRGGRRPEIGLAANPARGDCYAVATKAAQDFPGARVVHGHVDGPKPVKHHAWIEVDDRVIDRSIDLEESKARLEKAGVRYVTEASYEPDRALAKALRAGHWGPWHQTVKPNRSGKKLERVKKHFDRCFDVAAQMFDDLGEIELHHDEQAGGDNGSGSERQFGYCMDGDPIVIAFAAKADELPDENIQGLMSHEFGHALEYRYGVEELERRLEKKLPKTIERRADAIAAAVFGTPIEYDEHDVQCVGCGGQRPRPGHLAKNGPDNLQLVTDVRGAHHDQVYATIYAARGQKYAGRVDYSIYRGCTHIEWIEVAPEFRRAGVARELVRKLAADEGYDNIDWGMLSPEGAELKRAMDAEFGEADGRCRRGVSPGLIAKDED